MTDWAKLKVVDLKAELKKRDLPQHGLKAELVQRLTAADEEGPAENGGDSIAKAEEENQEDEVMDEEKAEAQDQDEQKEEEEKAEEPVREEQKAEDGPTLSNGVDDVPAPTEAPAPADDVPIPDAAEEDSPQQQDVKPAPSDEPPAPVAEAPELPPTAEAPPAEAMDTDPSTVDGQKRKRRSASPPPDAEALAKRARVDGDRRPEDGAADRPISPAIHHATPALYIANLMRPLRPVDMQQHLVELALQPGANDGNDVIDRFYMDQIRTHAFVIFTSTAAATRVRARLHDCVWPVESNRKPLSVDFVPPENVSAWIDAESGSTAPGASGRSSTRWEVTYDTNPDGTVEARHQPWSSSSAPTAGPAEPPKSAPTGPRFPDAAPLGPRGSKPSTFDAPPTGPRADRAPIGSRTTRANPPVIYTPVSEDLAHRRISSMHSFYTPHPGPYGREINRYSFESGDAFVDRGKEVFEGIRPPHRERAMRGGRGGRGSFRGGPPRRNRPRSDRYFPGPPPPPMGGNWERGPMPPMQSPPPRFADDRW